MRASPRTAMRPAFGKCVQDGADHDHAAQQGGDGSRPREKPEPAWWHPKGLEGIAGGSRLFDVTCFQAVALRVVREGDQLSEAPQPVPSTSGLSWRVLSANGTVASPVAGSTGNVSPSANTLQAGQPPHVGPAVFSPNRPLQARGSSQKDRSNEACGTRNRGGAVGRGSGVPAVLDHVLPGVQDGDGDAGCGDAGQEGQGASADEGARPPAAAHSLHDEHTLARLDPSRTFLLDSWGTCFVRHILHIPACFLGYLLPEVLDS